MKKILACDKMLYMDKDIKNLFLWYGENDFEVLEMINNWKKLFVKKYSNFNIINLDFQNRTKEFEIDLKNALQVNTLFGSNKLVVIKNLLKDATKVDEDLSELLIASIKKLPEGFFVIFVETKFDKRNKIYKQIQKLEKSDKAEIKQFDLPKYQNLQKWIAQRAKKYKLELKAEQFDKLAFLLGNDLWQIENNIIKLASFAQGRVIANEDISRLVKGKYNDDIFQFVDALSSRNKQQILKLFKDQIDSGVNEIYLLTMITRQFRIFLQIKSFVLTGQSDYSQIASELHLHPFVVQKSLDQVKNFSLPELHNIYKKLLDFEIKVKTTNQDFITLFSLFVVEL